MFGQPVRLGGVDDRVSQFGLASLGHLRRKDRCPVVTPELIERWLGQFARPIYIRDVGANVLGGLHEQGIYDKGPGSEDVLAGG